MSVDLQTPDVGNALRAAFDISGTGRFPMSLGEEVVPVAVVADVSDRLRVPTTPFFGQGNCAASVGNFSTLTFRNPANSGVNCVIEKIAFIAGAATFIRSSFGTTLGGSMTAPAQQRRSSLAFGTGSGTVLQGPNAIGIPSAQSAMDVYVPANTPVILDLPNPGFIVEPGNEIGFATNVANLILVGSFWWREEPR